MTNSSFITAYYNQTQSFLDQYLQDLDPQLSPLVDAMRYSLLGGGKRIRALLVYATGISLSVPEAELDVIAAAIEMIHAFSLIHDDLPAMDDDDLRRGQATCHVAYDEAVAILAGDALHTEAFELLSHNNTQYFQAEQRLKIINVIANSIGQKGMVQGQTIDVLSSGETLELPELIQMHYLKTGRLIEASVHTAYLASGIDNEDLERALLDFASKLGLAFQIKDDILDATADSDTLGKTAGKDNLDEKPTFISVLGLEESEAELAQLHQDILHALSGFPKLLDSPLRELADYVIQRSN